MIDFIKKIIRVPKLIHRKLRNRTNIRALRRIAEDATKLTPGDAGPKILLGPSFSVYHTQKIHSILLSAALAARGAKLAYLSAPFGLPFCQDCANITQIGKADTVYCKYCQRFQRNDANLIEHLIKYAEIFSPQDFVGPADLEHLTEQIKRLSKDELYNFSQDGLPLGKYALNVLRNQGYVGDEKLIPNYQEKFRKIIVAQMIYHHYFKRALESFRPDIIVSLDAFYSPWRILYDMAKQHNIPFYNYYPGLRHNTFHYDKNKISMLLNIDELFEKWKNRKIKETELKKLNKILTNRKKGKIYTGTEQWKKDENERKKMNNLINSGKPTAALYGNVLWDLTALNREVVFDSVQETFLETVKFFVDHPQYNLIVKPHPGDLRVVHESQEKLTDLIANTFPNLPKNILILHPKSSTTVYDLIPITNVSLVYTTTVGIESAMLGTPTVVLGDTHYRGKGFTFDPETPGELFATLEKLLQREPDKIFLTQQGLARKYYYLYFFVYFHDYDVIKFDAYKRSTVTPKNLDTLLEKNDFMKVVDAIINNQPVPYFDEGIEQYD